MRRATQTISEDRLSWVRGAVFAALVALAAWLSVRLLIAFLAPSSLWEPVEIAGSGPVQTAEARVYDFTNNPFAGGDAEIAVAEAPDLNEDAPETTLNLTLKGLRAGSNGSAFIRTPNNREDNFYIGDEVMPNVILRGVFPDHVLIEVNGQTQRLTTEDAKAARNAANATSRDAGLSALRTTDASDLLSKVQIIPALDRQMNRIGVSVKPRSAGVELSDFGLRDGDILTSIAGVGLTSGFPDIADLRRRIRPGQPVRVGLIRDGQPVTVTIGPDS